MQLRTGMFRRFAEVNHWGQYEDSTNLVGIDEDVVPCAGLDDGGFGLVDIESASVCVPKGNSSNHHSDDNAQTSETKRTSLFLVARLCRTTSSPTHMPNTTPRSTTTETDGHPRTPTMPICSRPSSGSFSRRNTITLNTTIPSMRTILSRSPHP